MENPENKTAQHQQALAAAIAAQRIALNVTDVTLITPLSAKEVRGAVNSGVLPSRRGAKNKIIILRADLDRYLQTL